MAKDDMDVIVYKILSYLYACMKSGKEAGLEEFAWESKLFRISKNYWLAIMQELLDEGYIKGIEFKKSKTDTHYFQTGSIVITLKGLEYLNENGRNALSLSTMI